MITVVFRSERTYAPCGSDHANGASASISTGGSDFRFWPIVLKKSVEDGGEQ